MKKADVIIQARMDSARLDGKILKKIKGKEVLYLIVERLKHLKYVDKVIVATTHCSYDDIVEDFCKKNKILYYRGDSDNVLDRFIKAAEKFKSELIIRATADDLLFENEEIDRMIKGYAKYNYDYSFVKGLPLGSCFEFVTYSALKRCLEFNLLDKHTEHVTLFIKNSTDIFKKKFFKCYKKYEGVDIRFTMDTPADYDLIKIIYDKFYKNGKYFSLDKVLNYINENPSLLNINKHVIQKNPDNYTMKWYEKEAEKIAKQVRRLATAKNLNSFFSIANTANLKYTEVRFPHIRHTPYGASGNVLLYTTSQAKEIAAAVDGIVDYIVVDAEKKVVKSKKRKDQGNIVSAVKNTIKKSKLLTFKANDMTVDAMDSMLALIIDRIELCKVSILGCGNLGSKLALKLLERGADISIFRRDKKKGQQIADTLNIIKPDETIAKAEYVKDLYKSVKGCDIIIGTTPGIKIIDSKIIKNLKKSAIVIDAGIGTIFEDAIELCLTKNIKIFRFDMRAGYSGAITTIMETFMLYNNIMGERLIKNIKIVSGGQIGSFGDVVVDNINKPSRIIGIADGKGGIIAPCQVDKYIDRIETIRDYFKLDIE